MRFQLGEGAERFSARRSESARVGFVLQPQQQRAARAVLRVPGGERWCPEHVTETVGPTREPADADDLQGDPRAIRLPEAGVELVHLSSRQQLQVDAGANRQT